MMVVPAMIGRSNGKGAYAFIQLFTAHIRSSTTLANYPVPLQTLVRVDRVQWNRTIGP